MNSESFQCAENRKQLQPFLENLIETVIRALSSEKPRAAELEIARTGDRLGAEAIDR